MSWNSKKKGGRGIFKLPEAKKDTAKKPAGAAEAPKEEEGQVDVNQQLIKANEEIETLKAQLQEATQDFDKQKESLSAELEKAKRDFESQNGLLTKNIAMNTGLKEQCRKKDEEMQV